MKARTPQRARLLLGIGFATACLLAGGATPSPASSWPFPNVDELWFQLSGVGSVVGRDYRPWTTALPLDLDGIGLYPHVDGDRYCTAVPALEDGQTYTIVSTTGGMTGRLSWLDRPLDEGDVVPDLLPDGRGCHTTIGSLAIHYRLSGPVQSVTATVVDASPEPVTAMRLSSEPAEIQTGEPVTFTATVEVSSGSAAGTVSIADVFPDNDAAACPSRHVVATEAEPAVVTCTTTYSGSDDMTFGWWSRPVTATFAPDDPAAVRGSETYGAVYTDRGATATRVEFDGQHIATATVAPAFHWLFSPSGSLEFLADGTPIAGCASQPLAGEGTARAACDLSSLGPGARTIVASYAGDESFLPSTSAAIGVTIEPAPHRHCRQTPGTATAPPAPSPQAAGGPPPPRSARRPALGPRHRSRSRCRGHRGRTRRCTTIRHRKHTRGAGGRAG